MFCFDLTWALEVSGSRIWGERLKTSGFEGLKSYMFMLNSKKGDVYTPKIDMDTKKHFKMIFKGYLLLE